MAQTSILGRIGQLVRANVNALLDSAEDPEKMLDQLIRDFTDNIAEAEEAVAQTVGNLRLARGRRPRGARGGARVGRQGEAASRRADQLRGPGQRRRGRPLRRARQDRASAPAQPRGAGPHVRHPDRPADRAHRQAQGRPQQAPRQARGAGQQARRARQPRQDGHGADARSRRPSRNVSVMDPTSDLNRFEERIRREEAHGARHGGGRAPRRSRSSSRASRTPTQRARGRGAPGRAQGRGRRLDVEQLTTTGSGTTRTPVSRGSAAVALASRPRTPQSSPHARRRAFQARRLRSAAKPGRGRHGLRQHRARGFAAGRRRDPARRGLSRHGPFDPPGPRAFSAGTQDGFAHVVLRLTDADGGVGYGEAVPFPGAMAALAALAPRLIGADPFERDRIPHRLRQTLTNGFAVAAISIALDDLVGPPPRRPDLGAVRRRVARSGPAVRGELRLRRPVLDRGRLGPRGRGARGARLRRHEAPARRPRAARGVPAPPRSSAGARPNR